jgi:hypothetical protein
MSDQLLETSNDLPRVIIAQRVIDKIWHGALLYPEIETGESMIGFVVPQSGRQEPDIYVLDTISPGEHVVREWGMFEQGNDWQGDVLDWLSKNWDAFRELRRSSYGNALAAKWDVPLQYVGDWHKHPGDMTYPSGGDAVQARKIINDPETPEYQLVAPLLTIYPLHPEKTDEPDDQAATVPSEPVEHVEIPEAVNGKNNGSSKPIIKTLPDQGWTLRIDFWYMSKRRQKFVPITPVVWPDDRLPHLPPVAWHLEHPKRFDQEQNLLIQAGYMVDIVRWDADGRPPYEIAFSVYKPGSQTVIILVTSADYPAQRPAIRIAPLVNVAENEDVFEKVYEASKPVLNSQMPDWPWDSMRTLLELVWHVEKTLKKENTP